MSTRSPRTLVDDQKKEHIGSKRPSKRNRPKQLRIQNVTTYDMENTNDTNKERNLFLANKTLVVPWGTERMLQRSRGTGKLLYIDQHILN